MAKCHALHCCKIYAGPLRVRGEVSSHMLYSLITSFPRRTPSVLIWCKKEKSEALVVRFSCRTVLYFLSVNNFNLRCFMLLFDISFTHLSHILYTIRFLIKSFLNVPKSQLFTYFLKSFTKLYEQKYHLVLDLHPRIKSLSSHTTVYFMQKIVI